MKRHLSLIPISRQHHGGLLTARLLQHDAPPYKGLPTTPNDKKDYLLRFYKEHLQPHFELEEQTVFAITDTLPDNLARLAAQLTAEHQQLTAFIRALPDASEAALPAQLHEIGVLLEQHIRTEEREFFEQLQQQLPEDRLLQLGSLVERLAN
ncbi:hemerythrin domain-containing protein [Pontibacter sp. CAU 1760]